MNEKNQGVPASPGIQKQQQQGVQQPGVQQPGVQQQVHRPNPVLQGQRPVNAQQGQHPVNAQQGQASKPAVPVYPGRERINNAKFKTKRSSFSSVMTSPCPRYKAKKDRIDVISFIKDDVLTVDLHPLGFGFYKCWGEECCQMIPDLTQRHGIIIVNYITDVNGNIMSDAVRHFNYIGYLRMSKEVETLKLLAKTPCDLQVICQDENFQKLQYVPINIGNPYWMQHFKKEILDQYDTKFNYMFADLGVSTDARGLHAAIVKQQQQDEQRAATYAAAQAAQSNVANYPQNQQWEQSSYTPEEGYATPEYTTENAPREMVADDTDYPNDLPVEEGEGNVDFIPADTGVVSAPETSNVDLNKVLRKKVQ